MAKLTRFQANAEAGAEKIYEALMELRQQALAKNKVGSGKALAWDTESMTIKALANGRRFGGYGVLWGGPDRKDLSGEWFTPLTEEFTAIFKALGKLPALYHHALDPALKTTVVGVIDQMRADHVGLWLEGEFLKGSEYISAIQQLVERGALGYSTGTLPGARKASPSGEILRWPIIEATFTPTPMEFRNRTEQPISVIKSAFQQIGLGWPGEGAENAQQAALAIELERLNLLDL